MRQLAHDQADVRFALVALLLVQLQRLGGGGEGLERAIDLRHAGRGERDRLAAQQRPGAFLDPLDRRRDPARGPHRQQHAQDGRAAAGEACDHDGAADRRFEQRLVGGEAHDPAAQVGRHMAVGDGAPIQRDHLVPAFLGAQRRGAKTLGGETADVAVVVVRAGDEKAVAVDQAAEPSVGQGALFEQGLESLRRHDHGKAERRLARPDDGNLDRDDRPGQDRAGQYAGNLGLAGFERPPLHLRGDRIALGQLFGGRPIEIEDLLGVLVGDHDPAAGQAGHRAFRLQPEGGEVVRQQGGGVGEQPCDRQLLAEQGIDRIHQGAGGKQDRLAPGFALVVGKVPDDTGGQQQERHRGRERDQHQTTANAPALLRIVQTESSPAPIAHSTRGRVTEGNCQESGGKAGKSPVPRQPIDKQTAPKGCWADRSLR